MITKIGEYMIGEGSQIVYDFTFHINYIMSIDKDIEQGMDHGRDTHDHDLTYENEQSTVTIPLKEYDSLKDQTNILQTLL